MDAQDLYQVYRRLDVAYANLETSEKIRNELIVLRRDQLQSRRKSSIDRLFLVGMTLMGGVPLLYSVLPESLLAPRAVWIGAFVAIAVAYAALGFWQWRAMREEAEAVESLLDETPHFIEDDPLFLEMQLSTFSNRRALVQEVLAAQPPASLHAELRSLEEHWAGRIDNALEMLEELHRRGDVSEERYQALQGWRRPAPANER